MTKFMTKFVTKNAKNSVFEAKTIVVKIKTKKPKTLENTRLSAILQLMFLELKKAGDGNRTHVTSLEGWCSTIELHPHTIGVTGFEPATSWSQTRRSSQTEPHPVPFCLNQNIV